MIDLPKNLLDEVRRILAGFVPDAQVWAFGSRVTGGAKEYSDLDLVVVGKERLPKEVLYRLQDAFEESTLPIRVDVLDWYRISEEFKAHIQQGYEVIFRSGAEKRRAD